MSAPQGDLPPVSDAVTNNVRVEVMAQHSIEHSRPREGEWVFQYTVRITNLGTEAVQLLSRYWIITDATGQVDEVRGPGVVGEQPLIAPGESFKYSSWCPLRTPTGSMEGKYRMSRTSGEQFDVDIAIFGLRAKYTVH